MLLLLKYLRDLYQMQGLRSSVNWGHLRIGRESQKPGVAVEGPFVDYEATHGRAGM